MNHQPFELLIFTQEELTPEQAQSLQEHLASCDQCYGLATAWRQVEPLVQSAQMAAPQPGFVQRWQLRLERERLIQQRRQSLLAFGLGTALALFFLLLLAGTVLVAYNSPIDWLLNLTSQAVMVLVLADAAQDIFIIVSQQIPIGAWLASGAALMALCILYILSLQKIATRRVPL